MATGSPFDDFPASEQLFARVVTPESRPRLHGLDVQDDLVRHYDFAEIVFTALVGRPPERHEGRGLNILMGVLLPVSVAEAPAHAAVIARICGAQPHRVVAAAAVALCEQAHLELDRRAPLLEWLEHGSRGTPPEEHVAPDEGEREAVRALHECLSGVGLELRPETLSLSPKGAIIAGFFACGVTQRWQLEALFCIARLPAAAAEAMAASPGGFADYPSRLPRFELQPEENR